MVTPTTAILVFLLIVLMALWIAIYCNPITFDDSRIRVFLVALVSLAIIMTVLFYYGTLQLAVSQQQTTLLSQTTVLGNDVLNGVLVEIEASVAVIPEFALSLLPLSNHCNPAANLLRTHTQGANSRVINTSDQYSKRQGCAATAALRRLNETMAAVPCPACVSVDSPAEHEPTSLLRSDLIDLPPRPVPPLRPPPETRSTAVLRRLRADPCSNEAVVRRTILAYRIFTLWQEVDLYGDLIAVTPLAYITNFLQRANSPLLYAVWVNEKINFNADTQAFGDLLFCYGLRITEQTPDAYVRAAQHLLASGECSKIHARL